MNSLLYNHESDTSTTHRTACVLAASQSQKGSHKDSREMTVYNDDDMFTLDEG